MAMSMTFTYDETHPGPINTVIATWVSAADGSASGASKAISGRLIKGITVPSATAAPDDNYNIVLTDANGVNILANCQDDLLLRDTADTEEVYFDLELGTAANAFRTTAHPVVNGPITVTIDTAGDTTGGVLYLYWEAGSR